MSKKLTSLHVIMLIAALLILLPIGAFAATTNASATTPDIPPWLTYAVGVLFNIAVVAKIRSSAQKAGIDWLANSGRVATILVFILSGILQAIAGGFGLLSSASGFVDFLTKTSAMAYTVLGAHAVGKAGKQISSMGTQTLMLILLATVFLITGFCVSSQAQALMVSPAITSTGTTQLTDINKSFAATVFWDNNRFSIAPIGTDLWRNGKLHVALFGLIRPTDKVQVGTETAIGYNIYWSKPLRQLFRNPNIVLTVTPYYGLSQDLSPDESNRLVTKPFPGVSLRVSW